jgi:cysteine-rich repeat protein
MLPRRWIPPTLAIASVLGAATPGCLLDSAPYAAAGVGAAGPGGAGGGTAGLGGGGTSTSAGGDTTGGTGGVGGVGGSGGVGGVTGGAGGSGGAGGGVVDGDKCPGIPYSVDVYSYTHITGGDTTMAANDVGSNCGGGTAPDVVYKVTPTSGGQLVITLDAFSPYKGFIHVWSDCDDPTTELPSGCGPGPVKVPVQKDTPVFVYVDGLEPKPSGEFQLDLYLDGCSNGTIEPDHEECDDGNILFFDGCSDTCDVECDCPDSATDCAAFEHVGTHHCYALVKAPDASWDAASTTCKGWGGTLAVLATQDEINAVEPSLSSGEMWIGANDLAVEDKFAWLNGEPWLYPNKQSPWDDNGLAENEPNGGVNENCVEIYSNGIINDDVCSKTIDYLCERPPAGVMLSP